jgi:hypothetical protein
MYNSTYYSTFHTLLTTDMPNLTSHVESEAK